MAMQQTSMPYRMNRLRFAVGTPETAPSFDAGFGAALNAASECRFRKKAPDD